MSQFELPKTALGSPVSERVVQKLEVIRGETLGEINVLFREKVQTEEKLDEIESKIHYKRGIMDAFEKFAAVMQEVTEGERLEQLRTKRLSEMAARKIVESAGITPDGSGVK